MTLKEKVHQKFLKIYKSDKPIVFSGPNKMECMYESRALWRLEENESKWLCHMRSLNGSGYTQLRLSMSENVKEDHYIVTVMAYLLRFPGNEINKYNEIPGNWLKDCLIKSIQDQYNAPRRELVLSGEKYDFISSLNDDKVNYNVYLYNGNEETDVSFEMNTSLNAFHPAWKCLAYILGEAI